MGDDGKKNRKSRHKKDEKQQQQQQHPHGQSQQHHQQQRQSQQYHQQRQSQQGYPQANPYQQQPNYPPPPDPYSTPVLPVGAPQGAPMYGQGHHRDSRLSYSHENLAQSYRPSQSQIPVGDGGHIPMGSSPREGFHQPAYPHDMQNNGMVEQRPDRLAAIEQTMESFQGVLNSMMTTLSAQEDRMQQQQGYHYPPPHGMPPGPPHGALAPGPHMRPSQARRPSQYGGIKDAEICDKEIQRFVMATPGPPEKRSSAGRRRSQSGAPSGSGSGSDDDDEEDALVTVFKKASRNEKVTVFMGNREIIDNGIKAPTLSGVVHVDLDFVGESKVWVQLLGSFEYGTADLDILGLSFQKDLYRAVVQAYPRPDDDSPHPLTPFQERLIEKLGSDSAFPFWFELASNTPSSVTLQPYGTDGVEEAPCGIFYAVEAFVATGKDNKPEKRSKVKMKICKFTLTPLHTAGSSVTVDDSFSFLMGSGNVKVQASLDKSIYLHGEHLTIDIVIKNDSSKVIKNITVSVIQNAEIFLGTAADYDVCVVRSTCHEGFPLNGGKEWQRQFKLCPADQNNRDGFALDGALKVDESKLASSTYRRDKMANKENMGIVVNYLVEVRLIMHSAKDVQVRVPFALTHAPVKRRRGSIYATSKPRKDRSKERE